MIRVQTKCVRSQEGRTNSFMSCGDGHTLVFEYGDRWGYFWISHPISCQQISTQLSQVCIQQRLGPKYTQYQGESGSGQYLQPFEGCWHMLCLKIVAAVTEDQDIGISIFVRVPAKIQTRGQTMLTNHPVLGANIRD
jgi:hypothetical protein